MYFIVKHLNFNLVLTDEEITNFIKKSIRNAIIIKTFTIIKYVIINVC